MSHTRSKISFTKTFRIVWVYVSFINLLFDLLRDDGFRYVRQVTESHTSNLNMRKKKEIFISGSEITIVSWELKKNDKF